MGRQTERHRRTEIIPGLEEREREETAGGGEEAYTQAKLPRDERQTLTESE